MIPVRDEWFVWGGFVQRDPSDCDCMCFVHFDVSLDDVDEYGKALGGMEWGLLLF